MTSSTVLQPPTLARGPASIIQEGLWIEESIGRAGSAYREGLALRISGPLDVARLEFALNELIQRHPALRTCFIPGSDGLEQRVVQCNAYHLSSESIASDDVSDWLNQQLEQSFDLARAPLHRVALARTNDQNYILVLVAHHLIVDGWSLGNFQRDLSLLYASGSSQCLPRLTLTPIDFALAQRQWIKSEARVSAGLYWAKQLSGLEVLLEGTGGKAVTAPLELDSRTFNATREMAKSLSVSPFSVFFAAFATAMHIATGRSNLGLATDFSNRTNPAYEPLIAMLVNQLPLRWNGVARRTAQEHIYAAHQLNLEALQHSGMPYPLIAAEADLIEKQLFEAKFVLHNMPRKPLQLDALHIDVDTIASPDPKFPALLELWESENVLSGCATIDPNRSQLDAFELSHLFRQQLAFLLDQEERVQRPPDTPQRRTFKPTRRQINFNTDSVTVIPSPNAPFPSIVEAITPDLDLAVWINDSRERITHLLHKAGAVLFRGFEIRTATRFREVITRFGGQPLTYSERSTPRKQIDSGVYTSTEYPADQEIFFHNENAYAASWPEYLFFWCETPPAKGGRTPLADTREVFAALPESIRESFDRYGVRYRRKFRPGLGLGWQEAFSVDDIDTLRARFMPQGYHFECENDGTLFADFIAPATVTHPQTGDRSWFNHAAIFHSSTLLEMVQCSVKEGDVSDYSAVEVKLGNGEDIPDEWIREIRKAYREASADFDWQCDDLLLVDNRITAHGRSPFTPPRRILVAMTGAQCHSLIKR